MFLQIVLEHRLGNVARDVFALDSHSVQTRCTNSHTQAAELRVWSIRDRLNVCVCAHTRPAGGKTPNSPPAVEFSLFKYQQGKKKQMFVELSFIMGSSPSCEQPAGRRITPARWPSTPGENALLKKCSCCAKQQVITLLFYLDRQTTSISLFLPFLASKLFVKMFFYRLSAGNLIKQGVSRCGWKW